MNSVELNIVNMPSQDFKYIQPSNKKAQTKNNAKVGGKAGKGGRIRVQAGDKRVPPSKSKPKNRKTVGKSGVFTVTREHSFWLSHFILISDKK